MRALGAALLARFSGRDAGLDQASVPATRFEAIEPRTLLSAAFDLIQLSDLRRDSNFAGIDGSGIGVAVLDTGIDASHPELAAAYLGGADFTDDGIGPNQDRQGHGTHVAGTVGARNDRFGVAPAAGLLGVQVLSPDGSGNLNVVEDALRWVIANRERYNIRVVNMSLGVDANVTSDPGWLPGLTSAIRDAERNGIVVVTAAGNAYERYQTPGLAYPSIASTISVGAVWPDSGTRGRPDDLAYFSQRFATTTSIFAPGVNILSTFPGGTTRILNGTSMASPIVAGTIALMQDAAWTFGGRYLTPSEVQQILATSAQTITDAEISRDGVTNTGVAYKRLNAYAAMQSVRTLFGGGQPPAPDPGNNVPDDLDGTRARASNILALEDGSINFLARGRIGFDAGKRIGPTDVDLYRFTVAVASPISIALARDTQDPADFDTYLRLFAENGTQVAFNDDRTGTFSAIDGTLQPGTYYVGVSGKGNANYSVDDQGAGRGPGPEGNYSISVLLGDGDLDGTFARAIEQPLGSEGQPQRVEGEIGVDANFDIGPGDVDMYLLRAPDDGFILIDLDSLGSSVADTFIRVYRDNGVVLGTSDDDLATTAFGIATEAFAGNRRVNDVRTGQFAGFDTDSFVRVAVTRGQTIYVGVSNFESSNYDPSRTDNRPSAGSRGLYTMFAMFTSRDVNGTIDTAVNIGSSFPGQIEGEIGRDQGTIVTGEKDVDFFFIQPTVSGLLSIQVDSSQNYPGNPSPFDSTLHAFDANGNVVGFNDDTNGLDSQLLMRIIAGQTYYFAVTGYGNAGFDPFIAGSGPGGETGLYRVRFQLRPANQYANFSDDQIGFSGMITVEPGLDFRADLRNDGPLIVGDRDVDIYSFVAPSTGILAAYALREDAFDADAVVRLFNSQGVEITQTLDSFLDERADELVLASVTQGETYYIGVSGAGTGSLSYNPLIAGSGALGSIGGYRFKLGFGTQRPTLAGVTAARQEANGQVTGVTITAGTVSGGSGADSAAFYIDFNRDGVFNEAELVGLDEVASDGLSLDFQVDSRWAPGAYTIGAVAIDANGLPSNLVTTSYVIRPALANRVFYPEGWSNERTIDEFIPLVNPNDQPVSYLVIAHYERRASGDAGSPLSVVVAEGTIPANSRGGVSITTRGGIGRSLVRLERGYAIEVQSTLPVGAVLAHYDNFNPNQQAAGVATGEALTSVTANSWFFTSVIKQPGQNFEFLLFFNPSDSSASVTVSFVRDGAETASVTFPVYANNRWGLAINDLPALANGTYGVIVTSTQAILAAHSAYTTDGQGDSTLGLPGEGNSPGTQGRFPFIDRSAALSAELLFLNTGTQPAVVRMSAQAQDGATALENTLVIQPNIPTRFSLDWTTALGQVPITISYTSNQPVAASVFQNSAQRGDSIFYPSAVVGATTWAIADAYLLRSQVGVNYFQFLTVANPSDTVANVTIDYLLYDFRSSWSNNGQSFRVSRQVQVPARGLVSIPLHAADSVPVTFDNRPEVHFSLVARGDRPIVTTYTHWDLTQGGGWDSWATPVGPLVRV
ncbi:MAG: S8 family serine peptidase [Planctomycetota bacterium]|nr:S8 family serine peptidase [Planctomycetota bacterium]